MLCTFRRAATQNEATVAIAAIDVAMLVDLKPDARVAKRCGRVFSRRADSVGAIAFHAARIGKDNFWRIDHGGSVTKRCFAFPARMRRALQRALLDLLPDGP